VAECSQPYRRRLATATQLVVDGHIIDPWQAALDEYLSVLLCKRSVGKEKTKVESGRHICLELEKE